MGLHTAFAVKHGATVIAGLSNLDTQTNPDVQAESQSGSPFPQFSVITGQRPKMMFATKQVAALLAVTGLAGVAIDATNNLVAYYASLGANGLPAATAVHRMYTANRGLLLPRRLTCAKQGFASVDTEALLYSADGAAHPLAISDVGALPVLTQSNILHSLGPMTLGIAGVGNSFLFDCPQNLSIDFGSGAETLGGGSDLYDTLLQVPRVAPVITITGLNVAQFGPGGVPPVGAPMSHAATKLFLRKRALNGIGFVPDLTAEHIKLTFNGTATVTSHTGQGTARSEVSMQIVTDWDGTSAPITINTASAIA